MTPAALDARTVEVLWRRDLRLFVRQRSRVLGALAAPLLLWLGVGAGLAPSFRTAGGEVGYLSFLYPGMLLMLLLQVGLSSTMSVIEDRRQGFLQGVLAAPGSRLSLVLGKAAGGTTVGLLHAAAFLLLAPLAGFPYGSIAWGTLLPALVLASLALTAAGFALAWALDSVQAYHVVMSLVLFPLWILSGAMFPAEGLSPVLSWIVRLNPMAYAVAAVRRGMHGGAVPGGAALPWAGAAIELGVTALVAAALLALAARACRAR